MEDEEKDIYDKEKRDEMIENDEIDSQEEGFMGGYDVIPPSKEEEE